MSNVSGQIAEIAGERAEGGEGPSVEDHEELPAAQGKDQWGERGGGAGSLQ